MSSKHAVVATYGIHCQAESAIKQLQYAGFNLRKLSLVGRDAQPWAPDQEQVFGCYNAGEGMELWSEQGAFWGGVWGLLCGSAFFLVPGLGPLLVAGPLVLAVVRALEGGAQVAGAGALGAGLCSLGITASSLPQYETALRSRKFLLIAHGTTEESSRARTIIHQSKPEAWEAHPVSRTYAEPCLAEVGVPAGAAYAAVSDFNTVP